jgi:hypothetical protein
MIRTSSHFVNSEFPTADTDAGHSIKPLFLSAFETQDLFVFFVAKNFSVVRDRQNQRLNVIAVCKLR